MDRSKQDRGQKVNFQYYLKSFLHLGILKELHRGKDSLDVLIPRRFQSQNTFMTYVEEEMDR